MKIRILMTGLLSLATATTFAQKGELNNAQTEYDKYETSRGQKITAAIAATSIVNAKTSIDKAVLNEKTSVMPQTFALKGAIYSSLALQDSVAATSYPLYTAASDAVKKAKELDTKGETKKLIDHANLNLAQYNLSKGVKDYQHKDYANAYKSFDAYRSILPEDTNAIYYSGLSAAASGNYPAAITNYNKLLTTNYSGKDKIYGDLSSVYLLNKDTTGALKVVNDAVTKYPTNADFRKREVEIALQSGKSKEVTEKINAAIANDPKNKSLYYYAGLTYSQAADLAAKELVKAPVTSKLALAKTRDDNYAKASEMYKKALAIDPNYFEANLNLGYVTLNPAIEMYNAANKLPANKQKEYEAAVAKAGLQFDAAKPYLVKAAEINPKSYDALNNLKTYYLGKKDAVHAAEIQKQLDSLK